MLWWHQSRNAAAVPKSLGIVRINDGWIDGSSRSVDVLAYEMVGSWKIDPTIDSGIVTALFGAPTIMSMSSCRSSRRKVLTCGRDRDYCRSFLQRWNAGAVRLRDGEILRRDPLGSRTVGIGLRNVFQKPANSILTWARAMRPISRRRRDAPASEPRRPVRNPTSTRRRAASERGTRATRSTAQPRASLQLASRCANSSTMVPSRELKASTASAATVACSNAGLRGLSRGEPWAGGDPVVSSAPARASRRGPAWRP